MSKELRFDGKVAVVTGAGNGLGRSHALLLASRGAKVVVNDLGGSFKGDGKSTSAADTVVAEIKKAGGTAVANYDSVTDGDKIVKCAIDSFGRIDILVNNAGILRDVSFGKMTQEDWDKIYTVHVLGSFKCTHAAFPYMRDQGYGRIIMTASAAGIYGNFGQANYSMAKLGLLGFSNTIALEGKKKNVLCNTIAPIAGSRMTETVLPPNLIEALRPEFVSPLVARLCHESSQENGGLFEVGGGFFGKLRWERSTGKTFRLGRAITPEALDAAWKEVTQFEKTTHPDSVAASLQPIMDNVEAGPSKGGNEFIDVDTSLGFKYPEVTTQYDERDLAMYALGVGAARNPMDMKDLQFVYEMHGDGMKALPTYGCIPAVSQMLNWGKDGIQPPGFNFGLDRILHGEQYTELKRPLPLKGKLTHKARIKDIFDKQKIALVVTEVVSYDEDGNEVVRNEITTVVRGAGGWGGERGPSADINEPPKRAPDKVVEEKIPEYQALLYRLSGDWNPLHADPDFAKAFGFEKPIIQGLCTFGYAGRQVVQAFAPQGNPDYFKCIRVRFASPVLPGDTLVTEMWKESDLKVIFRCKVKGKDDAVITNAAVELYAEVPKPAPKQKPAPAAQAAAPSLTSGDIFNAMASFVAANAGAIEKVKTVFQFKLANPESTWTLDLANPPGSVTPGAGAKPQCTLEVSDQDFLDMATGKADAMKLFSSGKLKISGDVMASQKLGSFMKKVTPEMVAAETKKRTGGGGATAAAPAAASAEPTTQEVFAIIRDHVEKNPELAAKIANVYVWNIKNPDSSWTMDLKNGGGKVVAGGGAADCTLEISDRDFLDMTSGKADSMKLFTSGKLKISGNVMASQKLDFLKKIDPARKNEVLAKLRGGAAPQAAAPAPATAAPAPTAKAEAPALFAALAKRLTEKPGLKDEVKASMFFKVTEPEGAWTVDLSGGAPSVKEGAPTKVTATFTVADQDLVAMAKGKAQAKDLFQRGKLRVDGDLSVAHRLGFLKGLV